MRTLYGFGSETEVRAAMSKELANWTWLSDKRRVQIAKAAVVTEEKNRFGPVFKITFQKA
jgi:hypothetical protein